MNGKQLELNACMLAPVPVSSASPQPLSGRGPLWTTTSFAMVFSLAPTARSVIYVMRSIIILTASGVFVSLQRRRNECSITPTSLTTSQR